MGNRFLTDGSMPTADSLDAAARGIVRSRVAVFTVSDGRPPVHEEVCEFAHDAESRLVLALEAAGHDVLGRSELISSAESAVSIPRRIADERPDLTIVNLPIWSFPSFTVRAAHEIDGPLVLYSSLDPKYPGMVAMLAAGGALDQVGRTHGRVCGSLDDVETMRDLNAFVSAGTAARRLSGLTFGRIGGRSMGMNTAVAATDQWMARFGVDVEEIDQYELVRRAENIEQSRAAEGRRWLERHVAAVHYDGDRLTPELLERQIRVYHAARDLVEEASLDFCGIKGQPELSDHYCTMDIAEAFLNDPYDWEGAKEPVVCATEADMDGALTMQILKLLTGTPVLFADVRHYHADLGVWDLCNSGQHATWFARRSEDPAENLAAVQLHPAEFYFPAGGASVQHLAAPGEMTFARLSRIDGRYRLQVLAGNVETFDEATNERLMRASTYTWPHAFARLTARPEEILGRYGANHIHAVPGDHVATLRHICRFLDIDFDGFGFD